MSLDFTTQIILEYRYWILIPLSLIEGPIVAFVAGTLASVGYFNLYFLAVLFFKGASIIAVVQYGTLLLAGYFLCTSFGGTAEKVIKNVQYIVAIATIAI